MFKFISKRFNRAGNSASGFTLVELLVAISVFVIVTSIVFINQGSFGSNVLISSLAYDVALTVRQAQVYGISVKQATGVSDISQQFNRSYGVHFSSSNHYILFVDLDGDGRYNVNADDGNSCLADPSDHNPECLKFFRIERGNYIKKFCSSFTKCSDSGSASNRIDSLDIVFTRPNPEPKIAGYRGATKYNSYIAYIYVSSPQGLIKNITVSFVGLIQIANS